MNNQRYPVDALTESASQALTVAGIEAGPARRIARVLVEADLMGHATHGLNLLPAYVRELNAGSMRATGEPEVVRESGTATVWDGHYLSGIYLTDLAVEHALAKAPRRR